MIRENQATGCQRPESFRAGRRILLRKKRRGGIPGPKGGLRNDTLDFKRYYGKSDGAANLPALRIYPVNHSGEGDDFANMLRTANPCDGALKSEAKPGVRSAAIAAQTEIRLEGF